MIKIYLAAQYSWRDQVKAHAKVLEDAGYEITSTWLKERKGSGTELTDLSNRFLREHAANDLRDIQAADMVIFFSVGPTELTKRGGRHVEFGLAYAMGKRIVVCGPKENIFHYLDEIVQFNTFEDLMKALGGGK
jgi:nucleoside 2-deoxyribosyltransferase